MHSSRFSCNMRAHRRTTYTNEERDGMRWERKVFSPPTPFPTGKQGHTERRGRHRRRQATDLQPMVRVQLDLWMLRQQLGTLDDQPQRVPKEFLQATALLLRGVRERGEKNNEGNDTQAANDETNFLKGAERDRRRRRGCSRRCRGTACGRGRRGGRWMF